MAIYCGPVSIQSLKVTSVGPVLAIESSAASAGYIANKCSSERTIALKKNSKIYFRDIYSEFEPTDRKASLC